MTKASELLNKVKLHLETAEDKDVFTNICNGNSSLEEVFDAFWSHSIIRQLLKFDIIYTYNRKKPELSERFRLEGNKLYLVREYTKALECFNYALLTAPAKAEEQMMCLAYGNRSAVFLEMKSYENCIKDIDRALENGYPNDKRQKLLVRKAKCFLGLNDFDRFLDLLQKCDSLASISELEKQKLLTLARKKPNASVEEIPATDDHFFRGPEDSEIIIKYLANESTYMSKSVGVQKSEAKGRHLVAQKDIRPGEVLMVEKAFCSVLALNDKSMLDYCCICLRRAFAPLPCNFCDTVFFCSDTCLAESYLHTLECPVLHTTKKMEFDEEITLVARTLCMFTFEEIQNFIESKGELDESNDELVNLNKLEGNINLRSVSGIQEAAINTILVLELLKGVPSFWDLKNEESRNAKEVGGFIMRWILSFQCNIHTIKDLCVTKGERIMTAKQNIVGYGIYNNFSLMNHSCAPNALHSSLGEIKYLYAISPIAKGEEITDSYGERYVSHDKKTRRQNLKETYFFDCNCVACENDWGLFATLPIAFTTVCTICKRPINVDTKKCPFCNISYDKYNPSPNRPVPYDFETIKNKIQTDYIDYNDAYIELEAYKPSFENVKKMSTLITTIVNYSNVPHKIHVEAQEALMRTFDLFGSYIFKSEDDN